MPRDFLQNHAQFADLIRIVAAEKGIDPAVVEKDYWIMHCLYGLQQLGLTFELKGGTSLSKGFQIIHRFSEDIDIRIEPPTDMDVKTNPNQTKPAHIKSRSDFYAWLTKTIKIDGIVSVERDTSVDNRDLFSAGNRLGWAAGFEPQHGKFESGCSCLAERTCRNPISTGLISGSKHSNFENRTESIESRASERNGAFRE